MADPVSDETFTNRQLSSLATWLESDGAAEPFDPVKLAAAFRELLARREREARLRDLCEHATSLPVPHTNQTAGYLLEDDVLDILNSPSGGET